MVNIDLERLLDEPIYAFDFRYMIGDIEDFLEFSESNIEWQYRHELRNIRDSAMAEWPPEYREQYREHRRANAEHRFEVSLPLRVRYGAVVALSTSVEWSTRFLKIRLRKPLSRRPQGRNETVHALCEIQRRTKAGSVDLVKDYEALVCIRNCIAHSAGIEEHGKYPGQLAAAAKRLGFTVENRHMLGKHVWIEKGSLNRHIRAMTGLVADLYQAADQQGILRVGN